MDKKRLELFVQKMHYLFAALLLASLQVFAAGAMIHQNLDYTDHKETFYNPDQGFYRPQVLHVKHSGTKPVEKPYGRLLHLRSDLSEFSSKAWLSIDTTGGKRDTSWGVSEPLTEDALNAYRTSFENIRKYGGTVIVRFCYDPWYNGHSNTTPDQETIIGHIKQLAPVFSEYADVITALEMGVYGAYGEMHSDTMITNERVGEAIRTMLENTPPSIKILSRTAHRIAGTLGFKNWDRDFNIDSDVFKKIAVAKGDTMYRLGMFNDGYLGTQYDYGSWGVDCATSICREEGVAWLEKYSVNTPYGGEALTTASGYQVINTPEFLAYEGFRTHTSYLNIEWNYNLINHWKEVQFLGKDDVYDSQVTGFKYIEDHLGYRYVLRNSDIVDSVGPGGKFVANLKIQNMGFGNLTREMKTTLVVKWTPGPRECVATDLQVDCPQPQFSNPVVFDIPLDTMVDFRNVHCRTISVKGGDTTATFDGTNDVHIVATWPKDIGVVPEGEWKAYLKIANAADDVFQNVRFANDSAYFVEEGSEGKKVGYNYIGIFVFNKNLEVPNAIKGDVLRSQLQNEQVWNRPKNVRTKYGVNVRIGSGVNEKSYLVNGSYMNGR